MIPLIKISLILSISAFAIWAENNVFIDADFPYRVVCKPEWVQQEKNDTVLLLTDSDAGKKTRLQLQKYAVDSGCDISNNDWSRLRYDVNLELILQFGKLGFVDTTSNKKLGGSRAFEIFAYYWEKTDNQTIWWAEYTRWTDFNGTGYMASVIGDTLDMKENVKNKNYVNLLDSISFSLINTTIIHDKDNYTKISIKKHAVESPVRYDLLGRNLNINNCLRFNFITVKKNMKYTIVR